MQGRIASKLRPVRFRQQVLELARSTAWGVFGGALAAIGLGLAMFLAKASPAWWAVGMVAPVAAGLLTGLIVGCARLRDDRSAAAAIDAHYGLKDRTATALDFLGRPEPSPMHELQVEDAVAHLEAV